MVRRSYDQIGPCTIVEGDREGVHSRMTEMQTDATLASLYNSRQRYTDASSSQGFVKVVKNKAYFKRYQVKFRRRRGKKRRGGPFEGSARVREENAVAKRVNSSANEF